MTTNPEPSLRPRPSRLGLATLAVLLSLHAAGSWLAIGGWVGVSSPWPLAGDDHPIAQHNAWVTRSFLLRSGTTAGYDPYFMSGYPKSLLSSPSSTLFEVVALATGGRSPALVHKVVTLVGMVLLPWLLIAAGAVLRMGLGAIVAGVGLLLLYVWTDGGGAGFPLNFARYGMVAYMVAVPVDLVAIAALGRFLEFGGVRRWLAAMALASLGFLLHVTSVLILAPAGLCVCLAAWRAGPRRFAAVALMAIVVVALNAFWWLPLVSLRSLSREGMPFFAHPESVFSRLGNLAVREPAIQAVLLGLAAYGLAVSSRRDKVEAAGLAGFAAAGLSWGYLAGASRSLDFLQPGRQTYALYVAAAALAGVGLADLGGKIMAERSRRIALGASLALALVGVRVFLPEALHWTRMRIAHPFLGTRTAPPHFDAMARWVGETLKPGERLYYEEVGRDIPGQPDPFAGGRYSGLLPRKTGVEVIGGFYLYVGLATNFTQIGDGRLFGGEWTRERFLRYAKLYRPTGILCWTREAKRFCRENPDLVAVSFEDGRVLGGRVIGFEGAAIRGRAEVAAKAGKLAVSALVPDLDGLVVLRYHFAPGLRSDPPMRLEPVLLEDDPVPFVGLRPSAGQSGCVLDLKVFPGR